MSREEETTYGRGPRPVVAVFAKAPEPGRVKTRLTPVLHAREAADLYRALLQDTLSIVERFGGETVVAFTPHVARRPLERLLGSHRRLLAQGPGDLGTRLANVFDQLCDGRRPVVAVGSDCPGVTPTRLREAIDALPTSDLVIGPAVDGGYYLIGMKRPHLELFEDVPWSTGKVLETTRERIEELDLKAAFLTPQRDIDTPEDLFEWYAGARAANMQEHYPRTWSVLHAMLPPRRFSALESTVRGEELD